MVFNILSLLQWRVWILFERNTSLILGKNVIIPNTVFQFSFWLMQKEKNPQAVKLLEQAQIGAFVAEERRWSERASEEGNDRQSGLMVWPCKGPPSPAERKIACRREKPRHLRMRRHPLVSSSSCSFTASSSQLLPDEDYVSHLKQPNSMKWVEMTLPGPLLSLSGRKIITLLPFAAAIHPSLYASTFSALPSFFSSL